MWYKLAQMENLTLLIGELSDKVLNGKGGLCQHGFRNNIIETVNKLYEAVGSDIRIEPMYVYRGNSGGPGQQKLKSQPKTVDVNVEDPAWSMIDVLVAAGVFPSKGQARKNWNKAIEVPPGDSMITVGKTTVNIHNNHGK
jgi:hypothetical protein